MSHNTAGRFILLSRNGLSRDKMNLCFKYGPTEQRLRNEGVPVMCLWDIHQSRLSTGESNRCRGLKFYRIYIPVALVLHFFKLIKLLNKIVK